MSIIGFIFAMLCGVAGANVLWSHLTGRPKLRSLGMEYDGDMNRFFSDSPMSMLVGLQWLMGIVGSIVAMTTGGIFGWLAVVCGVAGYSLGQYAYRKNKEKRNDPKRLLALAREQSTTALMGLSDERSAVITPLVNQMLELFGDLLNVRRRLEKEQVFADDGEAINKIDAITDAPLSPEAQKEHKEIVAEMKRTKSSLKDLYCLQEEMLLFFVDLGKTSRRKGGDYFVGKLTGYKERLARFNVDTSFQSVTPIKAGLLPSSDEIEAAYTKVGPPTPEALAIEGANHDPKFVPRIKTPA